MTIAVAVRTGTAVVFAADSKLTTQAPAGINPDGTPRFETQTYDHAQKIAADLSETSIAVFTGHGNIGGQNVADFFSRVSLELHVEASVQDKKVEQMAAEMAQARREFSEKLGVPPASAPPTILLLAGPPQKAAAPRVWLVTLTGDTFTVREILQDPKVWLEGSVDTALTLLYGFSTTQRGEMATLFPVSVSRMHTWLCVAVRAV